MKTTTLLFCLATMISVTVAPIAFAQSSDTTARLGTVVVSASKVPKPAETLTQSVTVISGDDLRARGITRVTDALREVPGAALVQNGSFGAVTTLFLRGGESRYTKVLIDGVAVNSAGGFFDFSHLTTDNIERIEIVRGPASVLYGADAVSGIVQIFTRKGTGSSRASLSARGGTYGTFDASLDAVGSSERQGVSFGAATHASDGILPFNNQYRNGTLSSAVTLLRGPAGEATVSARYTAAEFHYPTDFTGQPVDTNSYRTQHRLTVGLDASKNLSASIQGRVLAGTNDVIDLTEDIATPFGGTAPEHSAFRSRGYRRNAEARVTAFLPANATLTVGGGYEREHENSTNSGGPVGSPTIQTDFFAATRHNIAYYTELLGTIADRLSYTIAGRVDDNSDYERFPTYRLGLNAVITPGLNLRGSLSTAFNAPAFNQLRPTLYTIGSPDLQPEEARTAQVGFTASALRNVLTVGGTVFWQQFSDMIQFVAGGPPEFKGSYANLTAANANGFEAELSITPTNSLRATGSFTVVNPRVARVSSAYEGDDRAGDALVRRPTHSGAASLSFIPHPGANLSGAITYVGKRPDFDFNQFPSPRVTLPAYTKVDLSSEFPVIRNSGRALAITVRVENVFDEKFEDVLRFPSPGRTLLVGGRASTAF